MECPRESRSSPQTFFPRRDGERTTIQQTEKYGYETSPHPHPNFSLCCWHNLRLFHNRLYRTLAKINLEFLTEIQARASSIASGVQYVSNYDLRRSIADGMLFSVEHDINFIKVLVRNYTQKRASCFQTFMLPPKCEDKSHFPLLLRLGKWDRAKLRIQRQLNKFDCFNLGTDPSSDNKRADLIQETYDLIMANRQLVKRDLKTTDLVEGFMQQLDSLLINTEENIIVSKLNRDIQIDSVRINELGFLAYDMQLLLEDEYGYRVNHRDTLDDGFWERAAKGIFRESYNESTSLAEDIKRLVTEQHTPILQRNF